MIFRACLGWSLKHVAQNYLFIAISFYLNIAILCAKMYRVTWALLIEAKRSPLGPIHTRHNIAIKR